MDMNLLSGLLLAAVVVLIVAYIAAELFGDAIKAFFAEYSAKASTGPADANHHLIGAVGRVVEHGAEDGGEIKVRVGIERWKATVAAPDASALPVGAAVKVTGMNGPVLEVEEAAPEQPNAGAEQPAARAGAD